MSTCVCVRGRGKDDQIIRFSDYLLVEKKRVPALLYLRSERKKVAWVVW